MIDSAMVHFETALPEHLFQVSIAERIVQVPSHCLNIATALERRSEETSAAISGARSSPAISIVSARGSPAEDETRFIVGKDRASCGTAAGKETRGRSGKAGKHPHRTTPIR